MTPDDAVSFIFRAATTALQEGPAERPATEFLGLLVETGGCLEDAAHDWATFAELRPDEESLVTTLPEVEAEMAAFNSMALAAVKLLVAVARFPSLENIDEKITGKDQLF